MSLKNKSSSLTLPDLLLKAQHSIELLDYKNAELDLLKAYKLDAANTNILDYLSEVYIELGEPIKAYEYLKKSIQLKPDENPSKWMNIAQLQSGKDSLNSFTYGLNLLLEEKKVANNSTLDNQICSAYCSIIELYTTDLCDEPNAETECENLLSLALNISPNSPEVLHSYTNLRMIQQRYDEAKLSLAKVIELIKNDKDLLSYANRLDIVKMAYELEDYENCINLVDQLLIENDDELQLWYFAGMSYLKCTPPDEDAAIEYLTHTVVELKKTGEDPELESEIQNILNNLISQMANDPMEN